MLSTQFVGPSHHSRPLAIRYSPFGAMPDMWMQRNHPDLPFERYADDAICHCRTENRQWCCATLLKSGSQTAG